MRRLEMSCDGCDLIERTTLAETHAAEFGPEGWVAYRVVVRENSGEPCEIAVDLCPSCSIKMRHAIDPTKWSETKAEPDERPLRAAI